MKGLGARLSRTLGDAPAVAPGATGGAGPTGPTGPTGPKQTPLGLAALDARMTRWIQPPVAPPVAFDRVLPGAPFTRDGATTWEVERRFPLDGRHGDRRLGDLFERSTDHLATLTGDPRLEGFSADDALFIDIEATGLDHGAGTLAFVVGLGRREGADFVVRQYVLREPGEERALLLGLREALERARFLVSFNGKSYDLTVLQARFVMQRLYSRAESELKLRPHLDLLHLSKNLYRGLWPDTRLGTLEARALGFERVDDIPGHLVPVCWFAWLRHRDPEPLAAVARHNLDDVLSMVTLADRLAVESAPRPDVQRPLGVTLNLARLLFRRGAFTRAATLLDALDPGDDDRDRTAVAARLRADCARRLRDPRGRATALRRLLAVRPHEDDARRELATALARLGAYSDALAEVEHLAAHAEPDALARLDGLRRRLNRGALRERIVTSASGI